MSMRRIRSGFLPIVLSTLLVACAERLPAAAPATLTAPTAINAVEDLLAYYQSLRVLSPQALTSELQALLARPGGDAMLTMRKAMALGMTRDPNDLVRAQSELRLVLNSASNSAAKLKPLATLLMGNYADMRRLGESADKAGQQLRETQRRLEQLNEKLEALKNIERTLPASVP